MVAKRKIGFNELSESIGITTANLSIFKPRNKNHSDFDFKMI